MRGAAARPRLRRAHGPATDLPPAGARPRGCAVAGRRDVHRARAGRALARLRRPVVAARPGAHVVVPGRRVPRARRAGVAARADLDHHDPGHHRVDRRGRPLPGGRLARGASARARGRRGGRPARGHRTGRAHHGPAPVRRDEPGGPAAEGPAECGREDPGLADGRRRQHEQGAERRRHRELVGQRCVPRPAEGRRRRHLGARLARGVPLLHRAQPVLPAQGRTADPHVDRASHGRPAGDRPHDHPADAAVAARLLRRRHSGGPVQRDRHRPRGPGPQRAPGRRDHGHQLRRGLHPVPRRVVGRRVHGAHRARVAGLLHGDRHGRRRPARQRHPPADDPADRLRRGARDPIRSRSSSSRSRAAASSGRSAWCWPPR